MTTLPQSPGRVLLVGVGSGVRAIGDYLLDLGWDAAAFDDYPGAIREWTAARDIECVTTLPRTISSAAGPFDLVVHSAAIDPQRVDGLAPVVLSYPQAIGAISQTRETIAIAGTHGKSTAVALLAHLMPDAGVCGGIEFEDRSGRAGLAGAPFIVEACEFRRHFLALHPDRLVILNIDHDHPDCYADLLDTQAAFHRLCSLVPPQGTIYHDEPPGVLPRDDRRRSIPAHRLAEAVRDSSLPPVLQRSLHAAVHIALDCGAADTDITERLSSLPQLPLRLQRFDGSRVTWYSDYAHHPVAIRETIRSVRGRHPDAFLIAAFEAHQHGRLAAFFRDFHDALAAADAGVVMPPAAIREDSDQARAAERLAYQLRDELGPCWRIQEAFELRHDETLGRLIEQSIPSAEESRIGRLNTAGRPVVVLAMGAARIHDKLRELRRRLCEPLIAPHRDTPCDDDATATTARRPA